MRRKLPRDCIVWLNATNEIAVSMKTVLNILKVFVTHRLYPFVTQWNEKPTMSTFRQLHDVAWHMIKKKKYNFPKILIWSAWKCKYVCLYSYTNITSGEYKRPKNLFTVIDICKNTICLDHLSRRRISRFFWSCLYFYSWIFTSSFSTHHYKVKKLPCWGWEWTPTRPGVDKVKPKVCFKYSL